MSVEICPQCGNETLRTSNVMASTSTIYRACSNCCYREKQQYEPVTGNLVGEPVIEKKKSWKIVTKVTKVTTGQQRLL